MLLPGKRLLGPGWLLLLTLAACRAAATTAATSDQAQAVGEPGNAKGGDAYLTRIAALEAADLGGGRPLAVVATTSIVGDLVASVGADRIELELLMTPGVDPHAFQLTPRDLAAVSDADVVFVNGLGLEQPFLDDLSLDEPGPPIVALSEGIDPRQLSEPNAEHPDSPDEHEGEAESDPGDPEQEQHEAEAESDHEGQQSEEHDHGGVDPHMWFDPSKVVGWVQNLQRALSALDPAGAEHYQRNADNLIDELEQLDRWIQSEIARLPAANRKLVTDHDSLGYFADRYGLEIVGAVVPAYSTAAEPSARELAALGQTISELGVPAVFVGVGVNPALSKRVAQDLGVLLVPIYDGSLSEPDGPAATYLDFMRYNLRAIVEALR